MTLCLKTLPWETKQFSYTHFFYILKLKNTGDVKTVKFKTFLCEVEKKIGFYFLSLIFSEINVVYVLVLVWFDLYADEVLRVRKHSYVTPHSAALPVTNKSIFSLLVKPLFCVIHFFYYYSKSLLCKFLSSM